MKINTEIVKESARYVSDYFSKNLDPKFTYHNLSHTIYVVKAAEMLCEAMKVNNHHKKILLVAAWFHDLGYTQQIDSHETAGAFIAEKFLSEKNVDKEDIDLVKCCILSTHYPQKPATRLEEILCDADMMHLSDKAFIDAAALLRKEWEFVKGKKYTDEEWYNLNVQFVSAHQYHTSYGIKNLESHKNKNVKRLSSNLEEVTNKQNNLNGMELLPDKQKKKNKERLERGVETLFRTASSTSGVVTRRPFTNRLSIPRSARNCVICFPPP